MGFAVVNANGRGWGALIGEGSPLPLRIDGRAPALLALHGFGGTPQEVKLFVDVAASLGLSSLAPLLPGHGIHVEELRRSSVDDWLKHARKSYQELHERNEQVVVAGLSMGSLLALELALERLPGLAGLVLVANPLWLRWPFPDLTLALVDKLALPDFVVPKLASDIAEPMARKTHLTLSGTPAHGAIQIRRWARRLRNRLGAVEQPCLVVHGMRDRVCSPKGAQRLYEGLGSKDKELLLLWRSRHVVTRDHDAPELKKMLSIFLTKLSHRTQTPVDP